MTHSADSSSSLRTTAAPPDREEGPYTLTIHAPGRETLIVTLEQGAEYYVGRHKSSDIVLDHAWVSERHAVITGADPPYVVDAGSRNGTYVDGQKLRPRSARSLPAGSVATIGGFSILVQRGEELSSAVFRRAAPVAPPTDPLPVPATKAGSSPGPVLPIVRDARMQELYAFARQVAPSSVSILIMGETGVGKELMAQAIHRNSPRSRRTLVTLNCAAIPESLVESELFGYERGAFSGAVAAKPGLFEVADNSTFFLDEVGELPIGVQAKLLRVLETGEVHRLGAVRPTRVDVRIVTATNRSLSALVASETFRRDLYYRLNGLTISIPALRERPDDIADLANHFAARCRSDRSVHFTEAALQALRAHSWPGNVRELKSVVERAVLICRGSVVDAPDLLLEASNDPRAGADPLSRLKGPSSQDDELTPFPPEELPTDVVRAELERRERRRLREALERTAGNQTEAARLLGISRRTLMNRLDRFAMARPRKGGQRGDG